MESFLLPCGRALSVLVRSLTRLSHHGCPFLRRTGFLSATARVHGRYDDIVLELHQEQGHERQDGKEQKAQSRKELVGRGTALRVFVEGGVQNNVLVGQDHEDTQKESDRKGCGKSFEDKGPKDSECQVYQSRPNGGNGERNGAIFGLLQAHHLKDG